MSIRKIATDAANKAAHTAIDKAAKTNTAQKTIKPWAGMTSTGAKNTYQQLYALGTLSAAHFGVELSPCFEDGEIGKAKNAIDWFKSETHLPFLAQSVDLSILEAQIESVNVGHYQLNFLNGNGSGDIQISFIETKTADILRSAKIVKGLMFNSDGTQRLPKDYLMNLKIYAYDRHDNSLHRIEQQYIVALQAASVPFDATNSNGIAIVSLTFGKMFPMGM